MKLSATSRYCLLLAASLPVLMLGACAGNDKYTIAESINEPSTGFETVETNDQSMNELASELAEPTVSIDNQSENDSFTNLTVDENTEDTELSQVIDALEAEPEALQEEVQRLEQPDEQIISFAFNQTHINDEYGELLYQHAQYLNENPNLILHIGGHADASGAYLYNKKLSKQRAQEVAAILIKFGAPQQRVKVEGYASDQPLSGATANREHRRVELDYQDLQLVSK